MSLEEIKELPVGDVTAANAHLYLWVPNALLPEGLEVMQAWGFRYVSNVIWAKPVSYTHLTLPTTPYV